MNGGLPRVIPLTFAPNDAEILFQKNDEWARRFDVQSGKEQSSLHFEEGTGAALSVLSRRDKSKLLYSTSGACPSFELLEKGIVTHPLCSQSGYLLAMSDDGEWMLREAAEASAREIQFLSTRSEQVKWRAPLIEPRPYSEGIIDLKHHFAVFAGGPVVDIENGHELLPTSEKVRPDYYVEFGKDVAFFPHGVNFLPSGLALSFASASLYGTESIENSHASKQEARTAGVHWRLSGSTLTAQAEGSAFTWSRDRVTGFQPFERLGILVMAKPEGLEVIHLRTLKTLCTVRLFDDHQSAFVEAPDGRFEILGSRKAMASDLRCRVHTRVLPLSACVERYEWPGLLRELLKN